MSDITDKICIIDGDGLLYMSLPKKDRHMTAEECRDELVSRLKTICKYNNTDKYILCLTGNQNFRKVKWKYSFDYKGNRKGLQMPPVFYYLKEFAIQELGGFSHPKLEADDIVSYYSTKIENSIICSPDKDVLGQNIGTHFNHQTLQFVTTTAEEAERFMWQQIIAGDSGDSVQGIQGCGIKTIEKWFKDTKTYAEIAAREYINKYGVHEGMNRLFETFSMVYLLKSEEDFLKEIGEIPAIPNVKIIEEVYEISRDTEPKW